ncbi:hypothetical protein M422DRAFT_254128 [Sphaerobolus stellatus SS14]|uniref:JmjC domain-containing protein n=1 Tax=Sphaerobolus stellatus (strain SS14) TaxID=990650 RepID=A0A0C9UHY2_SPHS4|nr:hypothetical protein M422DRAFT_254128 [Sphaerobolus stellatus SS14]
MGVVEKSKPQRIPFDDDRTGAYHAVFVDEQHSERSRPLLQLPYISQAHYSPTYMSSMLFDYIKLKSRDRTPRMGRRTLLTKGWLRIDLQAIFNRQKVAASRLEMCSAVLPQRSRNRISRNPVNRLLQSDIKVTRPTMLRGQNTRTTSSRVRGRLWTQDKSRTNGKNEAKTATHSFLRVRVRTLSTLHPRCPPPHDAHQSQVTNPSSAAGKRAEGRNRETLDTAFLFTSQPHRHWLPPSDYVLEFRRALERMLTLRALRNDMKRRISLVRTIPIIPTVQPSRRYEHALPLPRDVARHFAWQAADMVLFSINYIHFVLPSSVWYAILQSHAPTLESFMSSSFPGSTASCPQFIRHKAYLASPKSFSSPSYSSTPLKPNVLVHDAGEFVVAFPRVRRLQPRAELRGEREPRAGKLGGVGGEREERERVLVQPQQQRSQTSPNKKCKTHRDASTSSSNTPSTTANTSKSKRPKIAPLHTRRIRVHLARHLLQARSPKPKLPKVTLTVHPFSSSNLSSSHPSNASKANGKERGLPPPAASTPPPPLTAY